MALQALQVLHQPHTLKILACTKALERGIEHFKSELPIDGSQATDEVVEACIPDHLYPDLKKYSDLRPSLWAMPTLDRPALNREWEGAHLQGMHWLVRVQERVAIVVAHVFKKAMDLRKVYKALQYAYRGSCPSYDDDKLKRDLLELEAPVTALAQRLEHDQHALAQNQIDGFPGSLTKWERCYRLRQQLIRAFPSQLNTMGAGLDPFFVPVVTSESIEASEQTFISLLERKPAVDRLYQVKFIASKAPNSILLDTATRINLLVRSFLRFAWAGVFSILLPLSLYVADVALTLTMEFLGIEAVKILSLWLLSAALLPAWAVPIIALCLMLLIAIACGVLGAFAYIFYIIPFGEAIWRLLRLE